MVRQAHHERLFLNDFKQLAHPDCVEGERLRDFLLYLNERDTPKNNLPINKISIFLIIPYTPYTYSEFFMYPSSKNRCIIKGHKTICESVR
jgi:hypothetical protein